MAELAFRISKHPRAAGCRELALRAALNMEALYSRRPTGRHLAALGVHLHGLDLTGVNVNEPSSGKVASAGRASRC